MRRHYVYCCWNGRKMPTFARLMEAQCSLPLRGCQTCLGSSYEACLESLRRRSWRYRAMSERDNLSLRKGTGIQRGTRVKKRVASGASVVVLDVAGGVLLRAPGSAFLFRQGGRLHCQRHHSPGVAVTCYSAAAGTSVLQTFQDSHRSLRA